MVNMAEVNQSIVKIMNIHQSKIDVVKFNGTNNFACGVRGDRCIEHAQS